MRHKYDPNRHHRRSIRLKGYDYHSAGAYFVTICTRGRECVLDDPVVTGIITDVWHALPKRFPTIELDEFIIMPNHTHQIVCLGATPIGGVESGRGIGAGTKSGIEIEAIEPTAKVPRTWIIPEPEEINWYPTLGDVIGGFKSLVFTVYLDWVKAYDPTRRAKFWQRNYYEHIIRNQRALDNIRWYIRENPTQWAWDPDNPDNFLRLPFPTKVEHYLDHIKIMKNM